jgi:hypothetical protein
MVRHPITGLNVLITGADLLDGGTDTVAVSQRSEEGQRILCVKEDIGKYDMWYGVVCKVVVMSSCMSAGCSLAGCRDMAVTITTIVFPVWVQFITTDKAKTSRGGGKVSVL